MMKILHIPIQDEEIQMIDDFKKYIKESTGCIIDDNEAVLLLVKYYTEGFKNQLTIDLG